MVGPRVKGKHFVFLASADGHYHNCDIRKLPNFSASLETIDTGHVDIQQDQVRAICFDLLEGLVTVTRFYDRAP
jgi:hypothetical protein